MSSDVFRLRASELRFLITLADECEIDAVGVMIGEMNDHQTAIAEALESARLLSFEIGWRETGWCRITALGRELVRTVRRC